MNDTIKGLAIIMCSAAAAITLLNATIQLNVWLFNLNF